MEETKQRLPRHKRVRSASLPFRLQERDIAIIKMVYDHRFLTTDRIQTLIPGSDRGISNRLQKLFHNGYLDRPKANIYEKFVYGLGNKGAAFLAKHYEIPRGKIDWTAKNKDVKDDYFIKHALMVADFRIILNLALAKKTDAKIQQWFNTGQIKEGIQIEGEVYTFPFNPDAMIILERGGYYKIFFLEADRGTKDLDRFLEQMKKYWKYQRRAKRGEIKGLTAFRVLVTTEGEVRKNNLRETTKKADDEQTGVQLFWFTSEKDYNMDNPDSILQPIWQTPKNDELHHLLE